MHEQNGWGVLFHSVIIIDINFSSLHTWISKGKTLSDVLHRGASVSPPSDLGVLRDKPARGLHRRFLHPRKVQVLRKLDLGHPRGNWEGESNNIPGHDVFMLGKFQVNILRRTWTWHTFWTTVYSFWTSRLIKLPPVKGSKRIRNLSRPSSSLRNFKKKTPA